ncbi:hypothetical_protein [Leishmania braziliensis MHOM/BR/75/M2904]|nr:hypothetical_protein [Leishmania braziliensis MHOM/BR/75/M2904]
MSDTSTAEARDHWMETATRPRSKDAPPPLQQNSDDGQLQPARTSVEAVECFANEQYFGLSLAQGNEDGDARSNSPVRFCRSDNTEEARCHAQHNCRRSASANTKTGTRDEDAAYSEAVSSVCSSYFSGHNTLTEITHERIMAQRLTEKCYGISTFWPPDSQASERAGDTEEQLFPAFGIEGAAPPSLVQPATRMMRARAETVATSPPSRLLAEFDDLYHVLSMPIAGAVHPSSRADSDRDSIGGGSHFTRRAPQQDIHYLNTSVLTLFPDAPASTFARQQRDCAASRSGSASVDSSCDWVVAPESWEYGEWMLTSQPATREALSVHSTGTMVLATGDERRSAELPNATATNVASESSNRPFLTTADYFPRTAHPKAVWNERQVGTGITTKAQCAPSTFASRLSRGVTDNDASSQAKARPLVEVCNSAATTAPPPLDTTTATDVCITMKEVETGATTPIRSVADDSSVVDVAVRQLSEPLSHHYSSGFAENIFVRSCCRASDGGAPSSEVSTFLAARSARQQPPRRPSYANSTRSVAFKAHTTTPAMSNGLLDGHQLAFTTTTTAGGVTAPWLLKKSASTVTTASVNRPAAVLIANTAPLLPSIVPPIRRTTDAPLRVPSPVAPISSTATLHVLSPQTIAAVGQHTLTSCAGQPPEVLRALGRHRRRLALLPGPDNVATECLSGVPRQTKSHSTSATAIGATSSTTSTSSGDLTSSSSPQRACAEFSEPQQSFLGAEPYPDAMDDNLVIHCEWRKKMACSSQISPADCGTSSSAAVGRSRLYMGVASSRFTASTPTATASPTAAPMTSPFATSCGLSAEEGAAHATEDLSRLSPQANEGAQQQLLKRLPLDSRDEGQTSSPVISTSISSPLVTARKATPPREEVHDHGPASSQESGKGAVDPTRSQSDRRRRMGLKENVEVVLPDCKSLRVSMSSWLEFRNPTMREQGKEMMPSAEEVYTHLMMRSNALCVLVVVDEDAVRKPCLVVSGLSVRVYEEDKAVSLANGRMAHELRRALRTSCGGTYSRFLCGSSYADEEDTSGSDDSGVGIRGGVGMSNRAMSSSGGGLPSNLKSFVLLPDKKERLNKSGEVHSTNSRPGEFDKYLHKFDLDETLSRLAGRKECHSVALEMLMRTWVTGHNTCLLLGNGNGRSTHSLDVTVGAVENAMIMLRERLHDSASRVELHICMGDVADDEDNGGVAVLDLLACSSDGDDNDDSGDDEELEKGVRRQRKGASPAALKRGPPRSSVQLARSPLFGTVVKGLRSVKIDDATAETGAIGRLLTLGFLRLNISTHSSRRKSVPNQSTLSNAALSKVHTSFATLRLKTICRGADMRSARLSAWESTTSDKRFGCQERHSHSVEYKADVLVSSLLLVYFGTEYMVLDTLVQRSHAYRMPTREEDEGFVHPNAPIRHQKPDFLPSRWPNAVGFLESLVGDALGGRTRTLMCLCLSEYDSRATLWLRAVSRARRITNVTPNCGNVRNFLVYLLEQYDSLAALSAKATTRHRQRRRHSTASSSKEFSQWSVHCVRNMIDELDAFLATPTGDTPSLERLEIANEMIVATPPDLLTNLPLCVFSQNY